MVQQDMVHRMVARLSMKSSLAAPLILLLMSVLMSKGQTLPCQLLVISSMALPTSILEESVQLCMGRMDVLYVIHYRLMGMEKRREMRQVTL
uniref:Uncharacterized protein n=1 Tax=Salix viminalis TaxID=40686 RepID=A0A6N2L0X4_SALVM